MGVRHSLPIFSQDKWRSLCYILSSDGDVKFTVSLSPWTKKKVAYMPKNTTNTLELID